MTILLFLIGLSLCMATTALLAFAWSVRDGQLDDLVAPAGALLCDDFGRPHDGLAAVDEKPINATVSRDHNTFAD